MKRIQRLKKLNDLLKHHNGYTIIDLEVKLDAGERTIRKDLEQIQQPPYNAVFWNEYRGKERLYRYKDVEFSLPLFDENEEMKLKLDEAIKAVDELKGNPQFDWLRLCLMAVENGSVMGVGGIMSFENNAYLEGAEHLTSLADAIVNKYPIKLVYQPYGAEEQALYVHPYHLKQYNNRWFLIGRPETVNAIHNYAVDRIRLVEHLSKPFIETDVDFEEYFDDIVGVSVNDVPVETVELMVSKKRYPYIKTKPLHWSQKHIAEKDDEKYVCLTIQVKPNRELESLLMSFGPDVIVKSPEELRDSLHNKVIEMNKEYSRND